MSAKTRSLTASRTVEQGRTHWLIKGQTKPYVELLRDAGADWDASKIAWRYDGDELPPAITHLLSDLQSLEGSKPSKPARKRTQKKGYKEAASVGEGEAANALDWDYTLELRAEALRKLQAMVERGGTEEQILRIIAGSGNPPSRAHPVFDSYLGSTYLYSAPGERIELKRGQIGIVGFFPHPTTHDQMISNAHAIFSIKELLKEIRKQGERDRDEAEMRLRNEGGGGIPEATKDTLKRIKKGSTVYAKEDIRVKGERIVPMNSKGTVVSRGKNALNVQFDTHPHIVLCTWDMITDQPIPYEQTPGYQIDQETTEAWRRGGINDAALESLSTDKYVKVASGGTHQSVDDLVTAHRAASKPVHPTSLAKGNPLREQYLAVKKDYASCILFWRLGDFYETFDEDAEVAARELDLVLTSRPVSKDERIAMAGVPQHALEQYIPKLLKAGYSVAVAEQFPKDPLLAGGIVERRVTRVETP